MRRAVTAIAASLMLASAPATLAAQDQVGISARAATLRVGGRMHAQYSASSVAAADNDFFHRRVRLTVDVTLNDFVDGRVQPDFARGAIALQDTYVRLNFSDALRLSMGQFKRAFDLFELSSSTDLSIIERDGRVEGIDACSGVGGVCSYSRLTQKLRYAERDLGLRVEGASGRVGYELTATNGTGINVPDENDAKSYAGRVTVAAGENVRVSGQVGLHDWVDPTTDNRVGAAFGADVELGGWRDGLHVQASVVTGDNWEVLSAAEEPATFRAGQIVASFYRPLAGERVVGVEPVARVSLADPDTGTSDDGAILLTPGLMLYFGGKNKIGANLDAYAPSTGSTEYSLKVQAFLYF